MNRARIAVIDTTLMMRLRDLELLEGLAVIFDEIRVPDAVVAELGAGPGRVKRWVKRLFAEQGDLFKRCREEDPLVREFLADLGQGEAAVIAQADTLRASVIIDERLAREPQPSMAEPRAASVRPSVRISNSVRTPGRTPSRSRARSALAATACDLRERLECSNARPPSSS